MYSVPAYSYIKRDLCVLKIFFKAQLRHNSPSHRRKTAVTEPSVTAVAGPSGHTSLHITVPWVAEGVTPSQHPEVACSGGVTHALLYFSTQMNHTVIKLTLHSLRFIEPKPDHILQFYSDWSYCGSKVNYKTVVL